MNDNKDWPIRPYPKRMLALAYSNLNDGQCALQQLWTLLENATLDGENAKELVRRKSKRNKNGSIKNIQFFTNEQVEIIFRVLGKP